MIEINRVAVLGAGMMGGKLPIVAQLQAVSVAEGCKAGPCRCRKKRIMKILDKQLEKGRIELSRKRPSPAALSPRIKMTVLRRLTWSSKRHSRNTSSKAPSLRK